jgi:hypothetical protein
MGSTPARGTDVRAFLCSTEALVTKYQTIQDHTPEDLYYDYRYG